MSFESMMGLVGVDQNGQPRALTVDENGALRFAGAPAPVNNGPTQGPQPSQRVVLLLARAPNGNPAPIQLDETGAIMFVGGPGDGDGGDGGEFMPIAGGQFTGTVM